jgi:hypothetical protein
MRARTIVLILAACLVAFSFCFAQDAMMGTWKLNPAKSKLSPSMPTNTTVICEVIGENVKVTSDGTDKVGKPTHSEWTGRVDGKDYRVTGDPTSDMRSYTKIDDHTLGFNVTKGGTITASGRIAVSHDGRTRTMTVGGTDSAGNKFSSNAVYVKQ